jgi:membrane associated rhomboid family serine protease
MGGLLLYANPQTRNVLLEHLMLFRRRHVSNPSRTRHSCKTVQLSFRSVRTSWRTDLRPAMGICARKFSADPGGQAHTIFTAMIHGGWLHLFGNMLYLWIFGDNIEDEFGPFKFLAFSLLCGVAATLAQYHVSTRSGVPNVGASGAIANVCWLRIS